MKQQTTVSGKRLLAASAAILTAVAGVFATGMAAAHADPVPGPVTEQEGSITVHKHANPGFGDEEQNPDGSGGTGGSPLAEVWFEACLIENIDLINDGNAAWEEVRRLGTIAADVTDTSVPFDGHDLSCVMAVETGADGSAVFGSLEVGAYLVRETHAPENVVERAAPFVVTVPTPAIGESAGEWLYDVHVYPKNTVLDAPGKNVASQGENVMLGDTIEYTIEQRVPGLPDGESYTKLIFTDTLDPKLDPTSDLVSVAVNSTALTADTDYSAAWDARKLSVTLTGVLGEIEQDDIVTVSFTARANANRTITNTGYVNVNDLYTDSHPDGIPTPEVETRWGAVDLTKVIASAPEPYPGLEGAEFELWMGSIDSAGCAVAVSGNTLIADNIVSGEDGTLGTIDSGTFTALPGLWVGDTTDGFQSRCYFVVETKAPAGFVLPTNDAELRTEFIVHPGETAHADDAVRTIMNTQQDVPELPLTGSGMQVLLLAIGGGLITAAMVLLLVRRRTSRSHPTV
ncbi:MAG: SpaH/EbpB family LPXTG-anchored major pilin [Leucobacter sp.]